MSQTIFIIDDDNELRRILGEYVEKQGHEAHLFAGGRQALEALDEFDPDLLLIDVHLPDGSGIEVLADVRSRRPEQHCVLITGDFDNNLVVRARKLGAETLFKPINLEHLKLVIESTEKDKRERLMLESMQRKAGPVDPDGIVGDSAAMRKAKRTTAKVAASSANTVLIRGETGTGKELFARAVHFGSNRREMPFIEVNCSAIPPQLLESELFGHERGSFTDAKERKIGLIERAHGGTFFLDEIGDMDFNLQAKILRVLEDRAIRRVGGDRKIPVDIRFIAATHKNLDEMIVEHTFREDLYFRLNVIVLDLPPLREREADIVTLAEHFLDAACKEHNHQISGFTEDALAAMRAYHWPGNVRELRNAIERAVLIEADDVVDAEHLHLWRRRARREAEGETPKPRIGYDFEIPDEGFSLVEFEKVIIARAMQKARYNVSKAARLLGLSRETMRYRLKKHDLAAD